MGGTVVKIRDITPGIALSHDEALAALAVAIPALQEIVGESADRAPEHWRNTDDSWGIAWCALDTEVGES